MLNKNDELEIVKRLSGVSDKNRININEIGWTSRVYTIDGVDNTANCLKQVKIKILKDEV